MTRTLMTATRAATWAASAALLAPAAQAGIVYTPASIVDHGSYISDTANHRDWYKFNNLANTIGLSHDAALAQFAPLGWSIPNLAQVQGLQTQFGWVSDTPFFGVNANYGLTTAMGSYLGDTSVFFITVGNGTTKETGIEAVTSEAFFVFGNPDVQYGVTTSRDQAFTDLHLQVFFSGDFVQGDYGLQGGATVNDFRGIWLSRDSARTVTVPEPGTWALAGLSLLCLLPSSLIRRRLPVAIQPA